MSLRNYFYRFGKYILTFFFVTLLMVLFGPLRAQAAITKEVTSDGFQTQRNGQHECVGWRRIPLLHRLSDPS